jgi:hypothetical protein
MCHSFAKPEVADVYGLLRKYDALIIHFSGFRADEDRPERLFPDGLRNAITSRAMELSCCVIGPRDDFTRHSWGCIGLVLGFQNKYSLVAADPHDCGSLEENVAGLIVRKVQKLKDLTLTDLEATITKRTSHNEWVVKDYVVLGMFAHPPYIAGDRYVKLQDLLNDFPDQPIFSFKDGSIYRCFPEPRGPIGHSEIYHEP